MKQEFITVRGKIILDNENLVIRNLKSKNLTDFYWVALQLFLCLHFIEKGGKAVVLAYFGLAIIIILFLISFIEVVFIYSWKNKLPLQQIKSYKVEPDNAGLETTVTIYLLSGRKKEIVFRTNEKQHEGFLDMLYQFTVQTQYA